MSRFKIHLGIPLDEPIKSGFVLKGDDLRQAMSVWLKDPHRTCLLTKPVASDIIDHSESCAVATFMECDTMAIWCNTADTENGRKLERYLTRNPKKIYYIPYGFGTNKHNHLSEFEITCLYLTFKV